MREKLLQGSESSGSCPSREGEDMVVGLKLRMRDRESTVGPFVLFFFGNTLVVVVLASR